MHQPASSILFPARETANVHRSHQGLASIRKLLGCTLHPQLAEHVTQCSQCWPWTLRLKGNTSQVSMSDAASLTNMSTLTHRLTHAPGLSGTVLQRRCPWPDSPLASLVSADWAGTTDAHSFSVRVQCTQSRVSRLTCSQPSSHSIILVSR